MSSAVASTTEQVPALPEPEPAAPRRGWAWWLVAAAVAVAVSVALTWPLAAHLGRLWSITLTTRHVAVHADDPFGGSDALQTMHVNKAVIDDLEHLREPFLDLSSGAAGPEPLRTTSLDVPWTLVMLPLLPLVGLVAAYNLTLLAASALTVVCGFGFLRRHTRWPLLALAGALAYAFVPARMYQLSGHFNAVMWWAFPAGAWAFEAMMQRHREGRGWRAPAAWLVVVVALLALSGEYHHNLYMSAMLGFLAAWWVVAALLGHARVPWLPALVAAGAAVVSSAYVLVSFHYVFGGSVAGPNGKYDEAVLYAPPGLLSLVHKSFGTLGEGLVYVGWPLLALAVAGGVAALLRRRLGEAAWAVLTVPVLFATFGPTADRALARVLPHGVEPYHTIFDLVPFLRLQRVSARLLVLAAMLLVLLAVVALDTAGGWVAGRLASSRGLTRTAAAAGALALVLATAWLLGDYRLQRTVLRPSQEDNRVVVALRDATRADRAHPFLGIPVVGQTTPWNAAATYIASQAGRSTLNAYNQSPAPWLADRLTALAPLNAGEVPGSALQVLRDTGTRQVVVINEAHTYCCGSWRGIVDKLVASGHFQLVDDDAPFALLQFTG